MVEKEDVEHTAVARVAELEAELDAVVDTLKWVEWVVDDLLGRWTVDDV
jgi:hypothetical protein